MATIKIGDRVTAGDGDDRDTGLVQLIDGDTAYVAWDSGVVTPCPIADIARTSERHSDGQRVE